MSEESNAKTVSTKNNNTNDPKYTKDDLIELVRAIKFSQPDASMRVVHTEITTKMSQNESFEFLQEVKLTDVKKVWKKAISHTSTTTTSTKIGNTTAPTTTTTTTTSESNDIANAKKLLLEGSLDTKTSKDNKQPKNKGSKNEILKFYTVGDGSVQTLAMNYTLEAAAIAVAQEKALEEKNQEEMKNYVSCFLDVPMDRSGGKPHQALMNFNDPKAKKKNKKANDDGSDDGREIVKIQVAASLPGMDNTPMLLYNFDRSAKTFIHYEKDDESNGYAKIKDMIITNGSTGALKAAGTKAYFYAFITRRKGKKDLVSIDTSELAPAQQW